MTKKKLTLKRSMLTLTTETLRNLRAGGLEDESNPCNVDHPYTTSYSTTCP